MVVASDPLNTRFRAGDRVACGGNECAFHAEYLAVPDLLVAPVPAGVENWHAAYTTLCAIALQAVRQTEPRLGDLVLVMGQGLVGLLVTNFLKAAGARVMAVDLMPSRRPFCQAMGAEKTIILGEQNLSDETRAWTDGYGVDAAVICAATQSNTPIEQAAEAMRDRGRFVIVGNTRADLAWRIFYEKELEVRYSRSYGPGRYDPSYEWGGSDYPIGYVRWTEQRNFQACLDLMARGQINLAALTTRRAPFKDALSVYQDLLQEGAKDIGVVLEYENAEPGTRNVELPRPAARQIEPQSTIRNQQLTTPVQRLDVIGAGNFARTMLLPCLRGQVPFGTIINATALSANHVRTKFGFQDVATDAAALLGTPRSGPARAEPESGAPSAVLIATRHHLHASLVKGALAANHHVFVEKPLCLSRQELCEIDAAYAKTKGSVMVGFNRRFAPASADLKNLMASAPGPKTASFRVMPGRLDPQHWYGNYAESGGRVLGEACHFLDYFCFLFDARPLRVLAQTTWPPAGRLPFPDSVTAQIEFADGSCGQLVYSAEGDTGYPKEALTVYGAGMVAEMHNFRELVVHRGRKQRSFSYSSKGHAEEMSAWAQFLRGQAGHPLPYEQSRVSMLLTFAVLDSIQKAMAVDLDA